MNDPFTALRAELMSAARRAELASPNRRWAWLRGRTRPLGVVIAALVICGSATAAVLSLTASSSQPLAGTVPGSIARPRPNGPLSVAGDRYRIVVTPSLAAGQAGWNTELDYFGPGLDSGGGSGAGGSYPTASNPVFGGTAGSFSTGSGQRGDTVDDVITGPQVAAVRIGDRTIRTFTSAELPAGDRAAVFFLPAGSAQPTVGWRPGQPIHSSMPVPTGPDPGPNPNKWPKVPTVALLPLDAGGHVLATTFNYPDPPFASFWQAPKAITPEIHDPPYHGPTHPRADAICELGQHGLPGLAPVWGHTIERIQSVDGSLGELFLSCVDSEYYLHGWPLSTGVLLDSRRPGRVLGSLPGAQPVPGVPGTVDFAAASMSARRVGNAWLVVRGGSGRRQRLRVLEALRIDRLDLHG